MGTPLGWPWYDVRTDKDGNVHAKCIAWNRKYVPPITILARFTPKVASCRRVTSIYSQMGAAVYPAYGLEHALTQAHLLIGDLTPAPEALGILIVNGL